jgi:hypothetical protein
VFPLWATLLMALLTLVFTITGLSIALAIWGMLIIRLAANVAKLEAGKILGTLLAILFFGGFATLLGLASYETSAAIIDGVIARLASALG